MKKLLVFTFAMFVSLAAFSQTHLYENPNFDKIAQNQKMIAVVPFKSTVKLRPKQMKDMKPDQLAKMEVSEGEGVQSAMYSWFLKREKRGELTVKVQSPAITNAKLKKAGITYDNMDGYTPKEIAEALGVDAVVMGTFETNKPMSEGASVVLGVLVGFWGTTNKAVLNLSIYNGADNDLLVNYNKAVSGSLGSSTEDLVNKLMRKASRRIAYTKKG
ncbi:hypothetical protein [Prolixibacter sp. NT017]|uniref:hypothetical protein n=1 Tax=Prolixibacter sp. NT017 TaxID=2652390 RepID=UPI00126E29CE|nr:hypothetical protein [Prolixibacter sp. NT017]GET25050.1 hypothetical protein NT017_13790 [Prolixibacter sp. NT017]